MVHMYTVKNVAAEMGTIVFLHGSVVSALRVRRTEYSLIHITGDEAEPFGRMTEILSALSTPSSGAGLVCQSCRPDLWQML